MVWYIECEDKRDWSKAPIDGKNPVYGQPSCQDDLHFATIVLLAVAVFLCFWLLPLFEEFDVPREMRTTNTSVTHRYCHAKLFSFTRLALSSCTIINSTKNKRKRATLTARCRCKIL